MIRMVLVAVVLGQEMCHLSRMTLWAAPIKLTYYVYVYIFFYVPDI